MTGLRLVDTLLPIGRGQRQLILGDRNTGKSTIGLSTLIVNNKNNHIGSINGLGSKRLFSIYLGINLNLSKLYFIYCIFRNTFYNTTTITLYIILGTHSTTNSIITLILPMLGTLIGEFIRDKGFDMVMIIDDLNKHSKTYRQVSLILGKVPSRDAFPAEIFNIHSTILERIGRLINKIKGSMTCLPIVETVNNDITEYIATNVISITDGQIYLSTNNFRLGIRPAIDSGLSVSRIGNSAQCMLIITLAKCLKNALLSQVNLNTSSASSSFINAILYQEYLSIISLEYIIIELMLVSDFYFRDNLNARFDHLLLVNYLHLVLALD